MSNKSVLGEARDQFVNFAVTEAEKQAIRDAARAAGISRSQFARNAVLAAARKKVQK